MSYAVGNRWLVAAACCWINVFGFALLRSSAVTYVVVLQTLHVTRAQAAWPLTLAGVFYTFAAPAAGVLARYVSVWKLTLAASVASAISISLCYFANGISYLIVCYGILQGLSLGFMSLNHTVINQNFVNFKTVASGISSAGFTIGSVVFPPLVQFFFDRYGIKGGFLLCGALMLNAAAGAMLQRGSRAVPVPTFDEKPRDDPHKSKTPQEDTFGNECPRVAEGPSAEHLLKSVHTSSKDHRSTKDEDAICLLFSRTAAKPGAQQLNSENIELEELQVQTAQNKFDIPRTVDTLKPVATLRNRIVGSLSFFAIPKFYIITFSFSQLLLFLTTYTTVIVDFALDRDIPKWNAVLLVTICAAVDMVSKLGSGWITDKGFLRRNTMMTLNFLLSTMALYLLPFCNSYSLNVLATVILGWCNGAIIILIPVFLMELVDAGKFSVCYGTATFLAGLPMLLRPLLIGYFRDTLGDYQGLFWVLSTLSACNVVLWCGLCFREKQSCNVGNLNKQQQKKHFQS
ncbi:unnamed protein product [Ixodes pacificus]